MRFDDDMGPMPSRTLWRFFPWFLAGGMGVVVAVNVGMAYTALHTFPGLAGNDGFDLSNHYDRVIDRVEQQTALGWSIATDADLSGHPRIVLKDKTGAALTGAKIVATAERPVGAPLTTALHFTESTPGQYNGAEILNAKGQWTLELSASAAGETVSTTRRILNR